MPKRPIPGKRPVAKPAQPRRPKTMAEKVNEVWQASGSGKSKGRNQRFVQALGKAGFEVKPSVQGVDVRGRGSRANFTFFRWPRKA